MLLQFGIGRESPPWDSCVACIGTFDGVHLGHRALINRTIAAANDRGITSVVVTFDRHPATILNPDAAPPALATLDQDIRGVAELNPNACVILPFDRALAETSADDFLQTILINGLHADHVVIGHDFAFGKKRQGNAEWLAARISTEIVAPIEHFGMRVSSSSIRVAIQSGDLKTTRHLLGRVFTLSGFVVSGRKLGRIIGFPTANLAVNTRQVLPPDGAYVSNFLLNGKSHHAVTNIGVRPTVSGEARTIETHLLQYNGPEFYGADAELQLLEFLRPEQKFDSVDDLKRQIGLDCAAAASYPRTTTAK